MLRQPSFLLKIKIKQPYSTSLSPSFSITLSLPHSFSLSPSFPPSFSLSLSLFISLPLSLYLSLSDWLTREHDASRKCGRALSIHHWVSKSVSQHAWLLYQGILKGEVSLYRWPPVWLVWNQLYDNWQFLFLFAKQTNPNQSNRRSTVQWYFPI